MASEHELLAKIEDLEYRIRYDIRVNNMKKRLEEFKKQLADLYKQRELNNGKH